jgi:hypothetical protein
MVRITPFLPLVSGAATLLAPTAASHRQESYATVTGYAKRELLTCEQTYGANWTQCGDADSTFCYNPSEGQVRNETFLPPNLSRNSNPTS